MVLTRSKRRKLETSLPTNEDTQRAEDDEIEVHEDEDEEEVEENEENQSGPKRAMAAWTTSPQKLITPRTHHAVLPIDDSKILIVGGVIFNDDDMNDNTNIWSMEILDTADQSITKIAAELPRNINPDCMENLSVCIAGDYIYICGGIESLRVNGASKILNTVYRMRINRLSRRRTSWETVQPMMEHRSGAACASVKGKIYVMSGCENVAPCECFDPSKNKWSAIPSIPVERDRAAVASIENDIYVIGGYETDINLGPTRSVNIFHVDSNCWVDGPDLPVEMNQISAAGTIRDRWIIVNGESYEHHGRHFKTTHWCFILDTYTKRWMEAPKIDTKLSGLAYTVMNQDQIYHIGTNSIEHISFEALSGISLYCENTSYARIEVMEEWTTSPLMTIMARAYHVALTIDDSKILIVGGTNNEIYDMPERIEHIESSILSMELLDMANQSVTRVADLPRNLSTSSENLSVCIVGDHIYLCGGKNTDRNIPLALDTVYRLSLDRLSHDDTSWETVQSMIEERQGAGCASVKGKIYMMGGNLCHGEYRGSLCECFDPSTNSWHALPPIPVGRQRPAVAVIEDDIYVIGGREVFDTEPTRSVNIFNVKTNSWRYGPDLPVAMTEFSAFSITRWVGWIVVKGSYTEHDANGVSSSHCWCLILDTKSNKWMEQRNYGSDYLTFRPNQAYIAINKDQIYRIGGHIISDFEIGLSNSIQHISFKGFTGITMFWTMLKPRLLVEQRRAIPTTNLQDDDLSILQHFITNTEDDIFRFTLDFI